MAPLEGWPRPIFVTPQKTRGIKYHPNLSDSDRDGLVLDTFGICLWVFTCAQQESRKEHRGRPTSAS